MKKQLSLPSDNRIVGYVRGSTLEQQNTLEAQENDLRNYSKYKHLELTRLFVDSGTSAEKVPFFHRPVIKEALDFMRQNDIRQMAVTKLDRAFRDTKDCLFTIDELHEAGISIHLLDIGADPNGVTGRLFVTMIAALAQFENGKRSERQIAAFHVMRDNSKRVGCVPYGWAPVKAMDRISRTGRQADNLVPDPREQLFLRQILDLHARGHGDHAIAQELNRLRVPSKKGGQWYASTVQSVREHARLAETETQNESLAA